MHCFSSWVPVVRLTHLPIPIVFLIFRVVGAVVLLRIAYALCGVTYPASARARLTSFGLIALSSGFGWVYWPRWAELNPAGVSVDVWQPEAFTFLSIYTSVLFVIATIFILTAIYCLVRGEQTWQYKYAVYAGLCGLVLGNIHSYDVLHIAAAWGFYLVAITIVEKKFDRERWIRAVIAGALTLPSTVYQYWVFKHETVFRLRALTPTLSPPIFYYAMGYGLVFLLAAAAVVLLFTKREQYLSGFSSNMIAVWVFSWAAAGLTIIYLPVEFQRKMAMGEHIPLCILAGGAAAYFATSFGGKIQAALLTILVLLTFPTNALFLARDIHHVEENKSEISDAQPFLTEQQLDVLTWIRQNTVRGDAVLALPPIGQFVPGYCDRAVWVGHWSETPNYGTKLFKLMKMLSVSTPDDLRYRFFASTGADYLVYPEDAADNPIPLRHGNLYLCDFRGSAPIYLQKVYETPNTGNGDAGGYLIFKIDY